MNNNNNAGKGKESDIITKKGFLISLPGKKKDSFDTASSINLAKPQNDRNDNSEKDLKNENEGGKKKFAGKNNKNDRNQKKHNNHNNKYANNTNNSNNVKNAENAQNSANANKNHSKHREENRNNRQVENKNRKKESFDKAVAGETNANREKHDNNRGKKHDKYGKKNKHNNNNRPANQNNQISVQDKNEGGELNLNNNRREKNNNANSVGVFSALLGDMANEIKLHGEKTQEQSVKELSLEEKYKNAKPLAEQIAEQELRNKGIKIPVSEKTPSECEQFEIVGVRFREAGKIYYFDPAGKNVPFGTPVIVETARGSEYGFVAISNRMIPVDSLTAPLKKIERLADATDTQKHLANKELEKDAEEVFREKVAKLGLQMNLIYVEYTFDNSRLLFYFTAETRIDFRELVKELASVFRTRIELRQIGVRDEAKMIGGLGVCGREACCKSFLGDFAQVSIKMAKDQSLSLNAAKISGTCGKLMCCLRYEDKVYEEENARTPKVGSIVETAEGRGHVVERNALKGIVNVQLDMAPEAPAKAFPREEVMVIGFNKDKGEKNDEIDNLDELKDVE